jgi:hypothetical protein
MNNILKYFKQRPILVAAILCLLLLISIWSFRLVDTHQNGYILAYVSQTDKTNYHSDDVGQPSILWAWQHGQRLGAVVGDDSWFIKYPIYIFTNNLDITPSKRLFINSWITLLATAIITIIAFMKMAKLVSRDNRGAITALLIATIMLAFLPAEAFGIIKMPNSRNIELAVFALILTLFYSTQLNIRDSRNNKIIFILLIALSGVIMADDPLFLYFGVIPFFLVSTTMYFIGKFKAAIYRQHLLYVVFSISLAYAIKFLLTYILPLSYLTHTSAIVSYETFISNWNGLIGKGLNIYGIQLFGHEKPSLLLISSLASLAITLIILYLLYKNYKINESSHLFLLTVLCMYIFTVFVYLSSNLAGDGAISSRYLIALVYIVPLMSIIAISQVKLRRQFVVYVLLLGISCSILTFNFIKSYYDQPKGSNAISHEIINNAESKGYSKGAGRLWHSNITTYLSNHKQNIVTVKCSKGKLYIYDVLMEKARIYIPAERSYYIWDSVNSETKDCKPKIFGVPSGYEELKTAPGVYMYYYDYDITKILKVSKDE